MLLEGIAVGCGGRYWRHYRGIVYAICNDDRHGRICAKRRFEGDWYEGKYNYESCRRAELVNHGKGHVHLGSTTREPGRRRAGRKFR